MLKKILIRSLVMVGIASLSLATSPAQSENDHPRLAGVDRAVKQRMEEGHFPGAAVAVLRHGEPVHIGGYGFANIAHQAPVTSRTVFELASLTKQMTALAVLDLAEQDRLSLDDRLVDHLDEAPSEWSDITIDQLLSHMAGLAHRFEYKHDGEFLLNYSRKSMLASASQTPMIAVPGSDWNYSDQGYFLLGLVIESVTGKSYSEYMQERFFGPRQMTRTLLLDQSTVIPNLAQGYIFKDGKILRGRRVWQFELASHFGVHSSLEDMIRWEAGLVEPEPWLRVPIEKSWEIQRRFDNGGSCVEWGYARGWWAQRVGDRLFLSHGGYSGTAYIRDVSSGLSAIVLTNREASEGQIEPMQIAWSALNAVDPSIPQAGFQCWE